MIKNNSILYQLRRLCESERRRNLNYLSKNGFFKDNDILPDIDDMMKYLNNKYSDKELDTKTTTYLKKIVHESLIHNIDDDIRQILDE